MKRRPTLTVLVGALVATLVSGTLPAAAAPSSFTFHGSGYGHGVGMSQWGAYGLARMGWGHQRILTHFYRHTRVVRRSTLPDKIRVGITSDRGTIHLKAKAGPVRLRIGHPKRGRLVGKIRQNRTWTVSAGRDGYRVRNGAGKTIGRRTWGGPGRHLYVTYAGSGSRVFVPEGDAIWYDGFVYGRGFLEFNLYSCGDANGCLERVVNRLPLEAYLYGLGEVPTSWPMQSLEAQAVAARSYAVYSMRRYGLRRDCNCHLTDGAGDQVYIGYDRERSAGGKRWVSAVERSRRQVVTYRGAVIQAFYAASDGGHSADVEDVWHGGNSAYAIPWLRGVCDPGESTDANPWVDWKKSFTASEVTSRLAGYTGSIGRVKRFSKIARGDSGRIIRVTVRGTSGRRRIDGTDLRTALGLWDGRVWINADRNVLGAIREKYDGLMCAPGLATSARRGVRGGSEQFFQKGGIFRNDRRNRTFWLKGGVFREYRAVGAGGGALGLPVRRPSARVAERAACSSCTRADFEKGRIYGKRRAGIHALWGRVLDTYLRRGGTGSALGFPLTRVRALRGGGRRALFEHGRIACPAGRACRTVVR